MIFTVTINPALDRFIVVEQLLAEDTTRILSETPYAAGKGIDVSRVIRELGGQSVALGLVGGYDGLQLEGLLINAGVMNQIRDMDYLILSGSLPRGVSPNLYGQLILAGKKKGAFIVLDADGSALNEALDYQPTCIKPNIYELSRLAERELQTESEILGFCEQIHRKGIAYIIVSRGKAGLLLSSVEQRIKAVAPPVEVDSTVGAGDSVVGGFVLAHSRGKDLADCMRLACAAGTATAQTPGTELCHRADVEAILHRVELSLL